MATNQKFAQLQATTLSGAGSSVGDITLGLTSFKDIDGNVLSMSSFGSKGWGTLEPNNSSQEEQFSFTGITQNSDGTATLTGVKNVTFLYPYTETSGVLKSHPGGSKMIISNTSAFYATLASTADDETISGVWTFTNPAVPRMDVEPTYGAGTELYFVTKTYADNLAIAGAPNASTTQKGIVQLPSQSGVDNKTAVGGTGANFAVTPDKLRATKYNDYVAESGTATAYVIAPSPVVTQYVVGLEFRFKAAHANGSGATTLNVNGVGAKSLKIQKGDPAAQFIRTNSMVGVLYDGTNFQITDISRPILSQEQLEIYAPSSTGNTAYVVALAPALTVYSPGLVVRFKPDAGGGQPTLNVNGLGAKNIKKYRAGTLANVATGDVIANQVVEVVYDGTQFQLMSATPAYTNGMSSGVATGATSAVQATNDGIYAGYITIPSDNANTTTILTDSSNPPTTVIQSITNRDATYGSSIPFCIPVKKGEYFKITLGTSHGVGAAVFTALS